MKRIRGMVLAAAAMVLGATAITGCNAIDADDEMVSAEMAASAPVEDQGDEATTGEGTEALAVSSHRFGGQREATREQRREARRARREAMRERRGDRMRRHPGFWRKLRRLLGRGGHGAPHPGGYPGGVDAPHGPGHNPGG